MWLLFNLNTLQICGPSQVFLMETVETGDKNWDDFHCAQISLVIGMWFILRLPQNGLRCWSKLRGKG